MAADGHAYERSAIERWLATKSTSPMTGEALQHTHTFPNHALRRQIRERRVARGALSGVSLAWAPAAGMLCEYISHLLDKPADPTILSHRTVEPNLTARKLTSLATHV